MEGDHHHDCHTCQRQQRHFIVIVRQNIPDIDGCRRHADHIGMFRIILLDHPVQLIAAGKCIVALLLRVHGNHDPRVVIGPHLVPDFPGQKALRNSRRQGPRHGQRVVHKWQILQRLRQLPLLHHRTIGHHGDDRVGLAKCRVDLLRILIDPGSRRSADGIVPVHKVVHALTEVAGHRHQNGDDEHHMANPVHQHRELVKGRKERLMGGSGNPVVKLQDQRRHQKQHRRQAADDSLGQHKAHILTDGEPHKCNHQESHDRGGAACQNRAAGFLKRCLHGKMPLHSLTLVPVEGVQQEYGIVHGHRQLQDRRRGKGEEGNPPEYDVGPHIQDDCHHHNVNEQKRLHPGGGGQGQDQPDDHQRHADGHGNLSGNGRLTLLAGYGTSRKAPPVHAHDLIYLIDGFVGGFVRIPVLEDDLEHRIAILVEFIRQIIVQESVSHIYVGRQIRAHHQVHAVHL